jgi:ribosomal protein L37E
MTTSPEGHGIIRSRADGICRQCGGSGYADDDEVSSSCSSCGLKLGPRLQYSVHGRDSAAVIEVMREIERQRLAAQSPWRAGLFYLTCLTTVTVLALVVARLVDWWVLPIVMLVALVCVVVLGALQLRQDGKITEKSLIRILAASFRTAKSVLPQSQNPPPPA